MKKFDLEDRFIDFTIRISNVVDEYNEISSNYERNGRVNSYNL